MAILGILASLLLPGLASARRCAQGARCTGNLRQLGLALEMYWDEHDGAAFRYRGAATNGGDLYWFGWLERGAEGRRSFDPTPGALWPYLQGRGVEFCPALRSWANDFKPKALGGAHGYGYNLALSAPIGRPPVRLAETASPASLVVLADAAQVNDFQAPASPDNPMLEEFYYVHTNEPTAHFRHRDKSQGVFADGHVAGERPVPGSIDARLPSARVGRLRDSALVLAGPH